MKPVYKIVIYTPRRDLHPDRWLVRAVEYNNDPVQGVRNARMRHGDGYQYQVENTEDKA